MFHRSLFHFTLIVLFSLALLVGPTNAQTTHTFEVNSLADTGRQSGAPAATCTTGSTVSCPSGQCAECTLRAAIETANSLSFGQSATITFASYIPTNSSNPPASMFFPVNGYDSIARELHIDATTHPQWDPADGIPAVIIRGDDAIATAHGLNFGPGGADSVVDAVTVYNFPQVGIRINANGVTVRQSHIGISAGGTSARPNAIGIHVLGDDNLIGHSPMLEAVAPWPNVISGNSGDGVVLTGANNTVAGNRIGVRKDGSSAVANGGHGIRVEGSQATIGNWSISGFLTLTARNQISGNSQTQIYLADSSGGASISCNRIGTNADGSARVSGSDLGIQALSSINQIGAASCRNVISGAVFLGAGGISSNSNTLGYNFIGTNANGDDLGVNQVLVSVIQGNGNLIISNTIGNGVIGISLGVQSATTGVRGNRIGTDSENRAHPLLAGIISAGAGNTFGGTQPGNTNVLGYIQGTAIDIGASASNNVIQRNRIGVGENGTPLPIGAGIASSGSATIIGGGAAGNIIGFAQDFGISIASTGAQVIDNIIGSSEETAGGFGDDSIGILVHGNDHLISQNHVGSQHTAIRVNEGTHEISDNIIGFDEDLTPRPNSSFGIRLNASENSRVTGNQVGFSNRGIRLNSGATGTVVGNNWLGMTPDKDDVGNALYGYDSSGAFNFFGTDPNTSESMPNIVGYNGSGGGVRIAGPDNLVINNSIGAGPMGVFPNGGSAGLILRGNPAGSQIGLSTTANSNYIGGNLGAGIEVREGVSDVQIGVNQIGLFGSAATPNQGPAIHLLAGASNISIVSPPVGPHRLHVANSSGPAIVLDPDAGTGNRIQRVAGIDNNGKLIDLGPGGRDQDPGDADTGPNNLQNFPEFGSSTSYDEDAQELTLTFRVDSDPANAAYPLAIDVYWVYQSGTRHGWFGSVQYPAASAGEFITVTLPNPGTWGPLDGPVFAATATDASGNTSEMSDPFDTAPPSTDEIFRDRFEPAPEPAFSFSTQMAPTFQHPRCMTCHAVEATNFQRVNDDPPGVLPASHPVVDASTNCTTCHSSSLLPPTGTIDPGWQSAPAAMDFRGLDEATLCSMASQPVSGHSPLEHMTEDRLVLWAVGDGRVPFGNPVLPTAPPNDIEAWRALVTEWVGAGMPCD